MNETQNGKTAVVKTLAIVGFLATITIGVWLMVQVVQFLPGTFSSLASIAGSINNYRAGDELTIATEKSISNSGDSFAISWTEIPRNGTYSFKYTCTEGISLALEARDGSFVTIDCEDEHSLPVGVNTVDLRIDSEKRRFSEVPFSISFVEPGEPTPSFTKNAKVTVVNASIPLSAELVSNEPEDETEVEEEPVHTSSTVGGKESVVPTRPQTTIPKQEVVTVFPQSYENGFTDLRVQYLGIGELVDGNYVARATLDNDVRGAIKFEVKNIGTKTSDEWSFSTELPSGFTYESDEQAPLKPNERVEFTLGFFPDSEVGDNNVNVTITESNDSNNRNDSFTWAVSVSD